MEIYYNIMIAARQGVIAKQGGGIMYYYYFVVNNRSTHNHFDDYFETNYVFADTTPAYNIYQKPDNSNTSVKDYTLIATNNIGSPAKNTSINGQYKYSHGSFLTTVNVVKQGATLTFSYPNGNTSTFGQAFYENIVTPWVP